MIALRHESFLLQLPFDAGVHQGFIVHIKDDADATRELGWEDYDLERYLGLDSPPVEGAMASTTLMFARTEIDLPDPLEVVQRGFPRAFDWARRSQNSLASRVMLRLRRPFLKPLKGAATVVQAVRIAPIPDEGADDDFRWEQFQRAIDELNNWLTALVSTGGDPDISTIARADLPALVVGWGWDVPTEPGTPDDVNWRTYPVNDRFTYWGRLVGPAQLELATWTSAMRDHPIVPSGEFLMGAVQSMRRGRFKHAVVEAGTGVELLVSGTIRLAGPVKGYGETRLSNILTSPNFASRVKDHFAVILGYDRDPKESDDALGAWWSQCYELRNRVVHRGYSPTEEEAADAVDAAHALHRDVGARLTADEQLHEQLLPIPTEVVEAAERERAYFMEHEYDDEPWQGRPAS